MRPVLYKNLQMPPMQKSLNAIIQLNLDISIADSPELPQGNNGRKIWALCPSSKPRMTCFICYIFKCSMWVQYNWPVFINITTKMFCLCSNMYLKITDVKQFKQKQICPRGSLRCMCLNSVMLIIVYESRVKWIL